MLFLAFMGHFEIWWILVAVLVLFGAKKLPELARAMGSSVNQFKKGLAEENDKRAELTEGSDPGNEKEDSAS